MTQMFERRRFPAWGRMALAGVAAAVLLSGCGGGGGGGGNGGSSSPQTVTVTGQLKDKTTSNVLPNRSITVQSSGQQGTSDTQGNFSIGNVPVGNITLSVKDSTGASDGTFSVDLSKYSGNPRNVGTVTLDIYSGGPPPPPS